MKPILRLALVTALLPGVLCVNACGDDSTSGNNNNPSQIISRDDALAACIAADACGVRIFGFASSFCLDSGWDRLYYTGNIPIWNEIYECVLEANGDCNATEQCFGQGQPLQTCSSISDGYCDGTVKVECDTMSQVLIRQDCALGNKQCVMAEVSMTELAPKCAAGPCDATTDVGQCYGNVLWTCSGGAYEVLDCSAEGLVCGDATTGGKACVGPGPTVCNIQWYEDSCEGHVLERCVHNYRSTFDCSSLPGQQTCDPATAMCGPAGTQCNSAQESCQGTRIRICVDGFFQEVDCAELGFSRCEVIAGGAHCRP